MKKINLEDAKKYLLKIPSVLMIVADSTPEKSWWFKFQVDIKHPLAWRVVQELGYVLNNISIEEKLPTIFYPVSPPPYLNGGPDEFLFWVIENFDENFSPDDMVKWLKNRLPNPVEKKDEWIFEEE